jgi:hypothetical protein
MKKFSRHKTYAEILAQCEAQGIPFNDYLYRRGGSDTVVVNSVYGRGHFPGHAIYNTFNGWFFGTTPEGVQFDSASTKHEKQPWYQDLLNFFYVA